ncbi:MAG TPA: hypothetical protein VG711_11070, partial [Phycisphaerales bacterium]|nr:hypothetical protein [Phycisphaerales bacterium]
MHAARFLLFAASIVLLVAERDASASQVDFNFTFSYSGSSISGRLIGLQLDANGNATEIDPVSVLIFSAPAIVGLNASQAHPYVLIPHIFERSTLFNGTYSTTTPNVYGFQVTNYMIVPSSQNLLMSEAGNDVTLVINFGQGICGECGTATYGIQAEEDALWPAINTSVSFTPVALPTGACCNAGDCSQMTAGACAAAGGSYQGDGM